MATFLERFYPYMPLWAQNLGISLYGLAWRRERLGGEFERETAAFRSRDRWSDSQLADYSEKELRRVLLHAFAQVPYYRKRWSAAGITAGDLSRMTVEGLTALPVTPKSALRADPESFVAQDVAKRQRLHRYASSGSTGTPVTAVCTASDHRRFIAAREARSWGWAGTSIRAPRAMIGGRLVVPRSVSRPPFHRYNWAERQLYFSAFHLAPAYAPDYVRALNRHRPRLLTGYAFSYYSLARMMIAQGLQLAYEPEALVLTSEKLTREMKRVIQQAFRARPYEEYGLVENCVLGTECEAGSLHVNPDFGILEIVDAQGHPVQPGEEGSILGTGLLNEAQPLVRYELGDVGIWSAQPCACGRTHLPVLQEIVGRLEDVVIGPEGRELVRFHGIFVNLPHVAEGQVIQEAMDRFTVKVVATEGFGVEEEHLIRGRFAERLGPVTVQIEPVPHIPRTERGKFRAVISNLPL